MTYGELEQLSGRVAGGLAAAGVAEGEAVGVLLPMTVEAVAALLGILRAGCVAVLVAESFAPPEVDRRLRLGGARLVITQEAIVRRGTRLELSSKLADCPVRCVVIPIGDGARPPIRPGDLSWDSFLALPAASNQPPRAVIRRDDPLLLGDDGRTQGDPLDADHPDQGRRRRVPLSGHRAGGRRGLAHEPGVDDGAMADLRHARQRGDDGPLRGPPRGPKGSAGFVEGAGVTVLGVVPSLVAAWREGDWPSHFDWDRIKLFSSTGECSRPGDMFYLMSHAGYRPVIEYCGGTEVGGGYLTSSPLLANAPGHFNTVAYGIGMSLRDDSGRPANPGEAFLIGPLGRSLRRTPGP